MNMLTKENIEKILKALYKKVFWEPTTTIEKDIILIAYRQLKKDKND